MHRPTLVVMAYGGLSSPTTKAMIAELSDSPVGWILKFATEDAAIDRARSTVATEFLDSPSGSDVLVMVDHDIEWAPGDLAHIAAKAAEHKAVVGGIVSKRLIGKGFGGRFGDGKRHEFGTSELVELGEGGYVGGAFMAIHRYVLEVLSEVNPKVRTGFHPFFLPMVRFNERLGAHEYLSEDWAFCERAKRSGLKVYASLKPVTTHWGEYGYTALSGVIR